MIARATATAIIGGHSTVESIIGEKHRCFSPKVRISYSPYLPAPQLSNIVHVSVVEVVEDDLG